MAADSLIDEHVSRAQCLKALTALHSYASKKQAERDSNELLPSREEHVWLVVGTKVMHPEKKLKPHRIPLKHPLVDPRSTSICLITKDPQREYKDKLAAQNINFISRVVGISKLKGKFKGFDARRALLQENGMFLADDRVIPLLPALLGSKFFQAKKQPIPVDLTAKDLKHELERAVESTYFHQNKGTCTSVKLGPLSASFAPAKLLDNLASALPAVVAAIKGGWDNVQNLHVKTSSSASLPIWTCELGAGDGARWDGLMEGVGEEGGKEKEKEKEKGKKRAAQADEDKDETPKAKKRKHEEAKTKDDDTTPKATPAKKSKDATAAAPTSASKKADDAPTAKKAKSDVPAAATPAKKSKADAVVATPASSSKKSKDDAPASSKKSKDDAPLSAKKSKDDAPASAKKPKDEAPASSKKSKADAPSSKKDKAATSTPSKAAPSPSKPASTSDKPKSALKSALKPASSPAVSEKPKSALKSSASEAKKEKHATFDLPADGAKKKKLLGAGAKKDKIVERSAGQKRREKEGRVGKDPKR